MLFVIRTGNNPLRSRPSRPLVVALLAVVAIRVIILYSPLAGPLGFVTLPADYLLFVVVKTATYLLLVEVAKRRVLALK